MEKFYNEKFTKKFEYLAEEVNKTVSKIATESNIHQPTLARNLSGQNKLSLETATILADYFGISIDYLIGRENDFGVIEVSHQVKKFDTEEEIELRNIWQALETCNKTKLIFEAQAILQHQEQSQN